MPSEEVIQQQQQQQQSTLAAATPSAVIAPSPSSTATIVPLLPHKSLQQDLSSRKDEQSNKMEDTPATTDTITSFQKESHQQQLSLPSLPSTSSPSHTQHLSKDELAHLSLTQSSMFASEPHSAQIVPMQDTEQQQDGSKVEMQAAEPIPSLQRPSLQQEPTSLQQQQQQQQQHHASLQASIQAQQSLNLQQASLQHQHQQSLQQQQQHAYHLAQQHHHPLHDSELDSEDEERMMGDGSMNDVGMAMKGGKKNARVSCHQCKTTKDDGLLLFCTTKAVKGQRKRKCRKKYCDACLRRSYNMSIASLTPHEIANYCCPACNGNCSCAACQRKQMESGGHIRKDIGLTNSPAVVRQPVIQAPVLTTAGLPINTYHPTLRTQTGGYLYMNNFIHGVASTVQSSSVTQAATVASEVPSTTGAVAVAAAVPASSIQHMQAHYQAQLAAAAAAAARGHVLPAYIAAQVAAAGHHIPATAAAHAPVAVVDASKQALTLPAMANLTVPASSSATPIATHSPLSQPASSPGGASTTASITQGLQGLATNSPIAAATPNTVSETATVATTSNSSVLTLASTDQNTTATASSQSASAAAATTQAEIEEKTRQLQELLQKRMQQDPNFLANLGPVEPNNPLAIIKQLMASTHPQALQQTSHHNAHSQQQHHSKTHGDSGEWEEQHAHSHSSHPPQHPQTTGSSSASALAAAAARRVKYEKQMSHVNSLPPDAPIHASLSSSTMRRAQTGRAPVRRLPKQAQAARDANSQSPQLRAAAGPGTAGTPPQPTRVYRRRGVAHTPPSPYQRLTGVEAQIERERRMSPGLGLEGGSAHAYNGGTGQSPRLQALSMNSKNAAAANSANGGALNQPFHMRHHSAPNSARASPAMMRRRAAQQQQQDDEQQHALEQEFDSHHSSMDEDELMLDTDCVSHHPVGPSHLPPRMHSSRPATSQVALTSRGVMSPSDPNYHLWKRSQAAQQQQMQQQQQHHAERRRPSLSSSDDMRDVRERDREQAMNMSMEELQQSNSYNQRLLEAHKLLLEQSKLRAQQAQQQQQRQQQQQQFKAEYGQEQDTYSSEYPPPTITPPIVPNVDVHDPPRYSYPLSTGLFSPQYPERNEHGALNGGLLSPMPNMNYNNSPSLSGSNGHGTHHNNASLSIHPPSSSNNRADDNGYHVMGSPTTSLDGSTDYAQGTYSLGLPTPMPIPGSRGVSAAAQMNLSLGTSSPLVSARDSSFLFTPIASRERDPQTPSMFMSSSVLESSTNPQSNNSGSSSTNATANAATSQQYQTHFDWGSAGQAAPHSAKNTPPGGSPPNAAPSSAAQPQQQAQAQPPSRHPSTSPSNGIIASLHLSPVSMQHIHGSNILEMLTPTSASSRPLMQHPQVTSPPSNQHQSQSTNGLMSPVELPLLPTA